MPIRIIRYDTCPNNYVLATPEISIDVYESRYDNRATYHRNRQQQDYSEFFHNLDAKIALNIPPAGASSNDVVSEVA